MRQIFATAFAALAATPSIGQEADAPHAAAEETRALVPQEAAGLTLDQFLWLRRPVVILADTPVDPRFQEQLSLLLERPEELLERDVVLIVDTDPAAATGVRARLRPRGFMLTLIGKDGRINLRKPFPWDVREISHAIDKWPLRQKEIRDGKTAAAQGAE